MLYQRDDGRTLLHVVTCRLVLRAGQDGSTWAARNDRHICFKFRRRHSLTATNSGKQTRIYSAASTKAYLSGGPQSQRLYSYKPEHVIASLSTVPVSAWWLCRGKGTGGALTSSRLLNVRVGRLPPGTLMSGGAAARPTRGLAIVIRRRRWLCFVPSTSSALHPCSWVASVQSSHIFLFTCAGIKMTIADLAPP